MSEKKNLTYDFKDGFRFVSDMKKDKQHYPTIFILFAKLLKTFSFYSLFFLINLQHKFRKAICQDIR